MTSASKVLERNTPPAVARTRRIHILRSDQELADLDLWPGDEVWFEDLTLLGKVNAQGVFVSNASGAS